jgi:hypothetical protein
MEPSVISEHGDTTIYVYLCTGEVEELNGVRSIRFEGERLLCSCGNGCISVQTTVPRSQVYFCSRIANLPPPPPA